MKKKNGKLCFGHVSRHIFTCAVVFLLIISGPALIAVDLTYLTEWINELRVGDFYTYLAFIGIISVWSVFGFITAIMRSVRGFTIYMIGLSVVTVVHFIIGFIHIMLLFTTYRPLLMDSCLQRQPTRFFWWSLGYENSEEMKKIYLECSGQWHSFATERLVSWIVYTLLSFVALYVVIRYQQYISRQYRKAQGMMSNGGEWSDDEGEKDTSDKKAVVTTYHDQEFPPVDSDLSANMYQQRQKLFDEIAKRKRARKSMNRKSIVSNASRDTVPVVHPLDLAQDPEVYCPPPMPPSDRSDSWNRYDDAKLKEDQEAIDRQKRVDALSTERLEYENYRSSEPSSRRSSVQDVSEIVKREATRRKRPKSSRWSTCYSDSSSTSNKARRLSLTHEDDEEEDHEHEQEQPLIEEPEEHNGHALPFHSPLPEEDNYDDIQHEDQFSDDEGEHSASNSLLMKPSNEEKI